MAFEPVVEARSRNAAFYECLIRMEQDRRAGAAGAGHRSGGGEARPDPAGRSPRARTGGGGTRGLAERAAQPQHLARYHDGPGLVGLDRIADARASRRRRTADRRDHRNRRDPGYRRSARLRHAAEELRQPDRDRRFRRRLHLVPQPAQARRRYREDRRRLRAEHRALGRRSRLRADADRSGAPARNQDGRRMGAGRGVGSDAARLGLRLHPGPADRARILRSGRGTADRGGAAGGGRSTSFLRKQEPIRRGLSFRERCATALPQRKAGGYGSRLRRFELNAATGRKLTLPSSALSTCARGAPACPSSDGADRRCCLLRAQAPGALSGSAARSFPRAAARTA